jgi:hypothetical protein
MIVRTDRFVEDQPQYDPAAAQAKKFALAAQQGLDSASDRDTSYTLGSIGSHLSQQQGSPLASERSSSIPAEASFSNLGR